MGTPATTRVSVSPRTQSEVGTTGDKATPMCDLLVQVPAICPHLSPGGGCRKIQCWRGVPIVPSVPIENAQVSTTPPMRADLAGDPTGAGVKICVGCLNLLPRLPAVANRSPLACWLTCKASVSHGLHTDREKRARLSPVRSDPQPAIVPPDSRCALA